MSELVELSAAGRAGFDRLLREHRLAAGLTQEALAERAGVGFRTVQDLEEGAHQPRRGTLAKLVRALGLVGARRDRLEAATRPTPRGRGSRAQPLRLTSRPDRFPTSNSTSHHNLPVQLTSFVGRARELAELTDQLRETRLLTLTGTGGCGKTRLALRTVEPLVDVYPDGVWFVELAPIDDPTFVPQSIAAALGVHEAPPNPLYRTILDYLRTRRLLLLVDNCEHVIAASTRLIEMILRTCPDVTIMATSREALNLAGEVAWRVPSLTLPGDNDQPISQDLPGKSMVSEAVRLFIERAKAADAGFEVTPANAPAIAQICRRLDGIPLALELAAARLKVLSVEQVAARLDDRFRLLTGGSRTALTRQKTLRATLDWSYNLLSEPERRTLRCLSVFPSGCTLEAAEAVCSDRDVLDLLSQLVDKSLVLVDKDAPEPRYWLLETIRQYGRDRLVEADEADEARERHLNWCVELAARAEPELLGPRQVEWLRRLETENDNLRTALEWGLASSPEVGARLAGHLWQFWYIFRSQISEGLRWLNSALAVARPGTPLYAKLLVGKGLLLRDQSDSDAPDRSRACSEEAVYLCRRLGEDLWCGWALNNLGCIALGTDHVRCRVLQEESIRLFRSAGDRAAIGMGLRDLATAMWGENDNARALFLLEESQAILREVGDNWNLAWTLSSLADEALHRKDFAHARAMARESLAKFKRIGNVVGILRAQIVIADAARLIGETNVAYDLLRDALMPFQGREMGPTYRIDWCLLALGMLAIQRGNTRHGVALVGATRSKLKVIVNQTGVDREACETSLALVADPTGASGRIDVDRGQYETSLALARSVLGENVFELAIAEAMTRQQAIAYALGTRCAD